MPIQSTKRHILKEAKILAATRLTLWKDRELVSYSLIGKTSNVFLRNQSTEKSWKFESSCEHMDKKAELDRVFSLYIRLRDADDMGMIRCISCGRKMPFRHFDAGHYFSRSHTSTRWDEDNVHAECIECNRFAQNHLEGYRENLIDKIGLRRLNALEERHKEVLQESNIDVDEMIAKYKRLCRTLSKEKGIKINL